jgi:hypothetical protein
MLNTELRLFPDHRGRLDLSLRAFARLAQNEESGLRGGDAGGRGRLRKINWLPWSSYFYGERRMAIVNQFVKAGDFWSGMVEPDYRDQTNDTSNLRAALHCAISLFHMSDWVFHTHESQVRASFTFRDTDALNKPVCSPETFANSLEAINEDFARLRGICHAGKHLKLRNIRRVPGYPSHAANTRPQSTGFGAGAWGSGPYGGTPRVMLEGGGPGGADAEFSLIAQSVYQMWRDLNAAHSRWQEI